MKIASYPIYKINNQIQQNNISSRNTQSSSETQKMNGLSCIANYNIPFCAGNSVYAINYDGSYEKIDSAAEACKKYDSVAIYSCLNGKTYASDGKVFVYADEIENREGKIDSSAFVSVLSNFKYSNGQPIYSIDIDGNIQRFDCAQDMSKKLNINLDRISQILSENMETTKGYTFIRAFDVEMRDENGNLLLDENNKPIVDRKKINKAREKFLNAEKNSQIICVNKDCEIKRYKNLKEVANDMNCAYQNVAKALSSTRIIENKYILLRLSDFVLTDKFGDIVFDEDNNFAIDTDKVKNTIKIAFLN